MIDTEAQQACCETLTHYLFRNEDALVIGIPHENAVALTWPEHKGGGYIALRFCPWCGAMLPDPVQPEIFESTVIDNLSEAELEEEPYLRPNPLV